MSSFVISKTEYIKAAGLMYGIAKARRYSHKYFLENIKEWFAKCYELNIESVNEQYGKDCIPNPCTYDDIFKGYCKIGEEIWRGERADITPQALRIRLIKFFMSVRYQIENKAAARYVSQIFFDCMAKFFDDELQDVDGWWGEIEIYK